MTKGQAELFSRLDEITEQGRQNASKLELIRQNLFGSEEDHFEAGRLPILERNFTDLAERVKPLEAPREFAPQSVLRELDQLGRELRALEKVACRRMPLPLVEFHPPRWHTENTPIRKGRTPAVGCKQM